MFMAAGACSAVWLQLRLLSQARQQAQPSVKGSGNGSGSSASELSLPEASEDLLHAEAARRRDSGGSAGSSADANGDGTAINGSGQRESIAQPSAPRSTGESRRMCCTTPGTRGNEPALVPYDTMLYGMITLCPSDTASFGFAGGAATQQAPEKAVDEEASKQQQQKQQQRSRSGVSTWIRLPHIPSLRRPQTPQPDLPPVPVCWQTCFKVPCIFKSEHLSKSD